MSSIFDPANSDYASSWDPAFARKKIAMYNRAMEAKKQGEDYLACNLAREAVSKYIGLPEVSPGREEYWWNTCIESVNEVYKDLARAALGKFGYFAEAIEKNNRALIVLKHQTQGYFYCDFYLILGSDRDQNVDRYTFEASNVLGIPYDTKRETLKIQRGGRSLPDLFRESLASAGITSAVSIQVI